MDRFRTAVASWTLIPCLTLIPAGTPAPAAADVLPLRGGDWIETRGPWRIEGNRVVYRTPEGALRSLPLAELAPPAGGRRPGGGTRLGEDPWGPIPEIPPPGPLPLPRPPLARPRPLPAPPVCVLANATPGGPAELLCEAPGPASVLALPSGPLPAE